jgi:hypothetical protein
MGRPPLPVGTAGEVRTYPVRGGFRARCLVRDYDGEVRELERFGRSEAKAKIQLREAVRDHHRGEADAEITSETRLAEVVRVWLVDLRAEVAAGVKSPGTGALYDATAEWITTGLGDLRLRELTVGPGGSLPYSDGQAPRPRVGEEGQNSAERGVRSGRPPRWDPH